MRDLPASISAIDAAPPVAIDRRNLALVIICLGMMATFLTITETISTLPSMQRALHASSSSVVWAASIYTTVLASLVLTAATIGDILGRRRAFAIGLAVLGAGSMVVVLSEDVVAVIAGQAVMGVGSALVLPNSLALVTHMFTEHHERTTAVGTWAAVSGLGLALGPIIAGVLMQWFSWHSAFLAIVAIALTALSLTPFFLPESRHPGRRLDPPGLLAGIVAIGSLNYGLIQGGHQGYGRPGIILSFCLAATSTAIFLAVEWRSPAPMIHLRLFCHASFTAANVAALIGQFAFVGLALVEVLYFQRVYEYSVLSSGIRLLPMMAVYVAISASGSRLIRRFGFKTVITAGLIVASGSAFLLLIQRPSTPYWQIAVAMALFGLGDGLILAPSTAAAVISAPNHQAGMASGSVNMFRQIGGAVGASIMGTVMTSGLASDLPRALTARGVPAPAAAQIARAATSGATSAGTPPGLHHTIVTAVGSSFTLAIHHALLIPAVAALTVAAVAARLIHAHPQPQ